MSNATNPFKMVYSTLWEMALAHSELRRLVLPGNRVRFDVEDNQHVMKPTVAPADLPELMLIASTLSANLFDTSSSSQCQRQYSWVIATGDLRYSNGLSDIEWALYCAMHGWKQRLSALRWPCDATSGFVKNLQPVSASLSLLDPEKNRNIKGWSAAWTIDVTMYFTSSLLLAELDEVEEEE
jgi:hypothetical protein